VSASPQVGISKRPHPKLTSVARVHYTKTKYALWFFTLLSIAAVAFVIGVSDKSPVLVLTSAGLAYLAAQSFFGIRKRFTHTNDDIPRRVQKLAELIDHARADIVILAGSLFHKVYDHPAVLMAFKRAHFRDVIVTIYYTSDRLDPETHLFVEFAKEAGWPIAPLKLSMPHVVVVDRTHLREELESASDDAPRKLALIRYDVPRRARERYDQILEAAAAEQERRETVRK
jgi:hypothetical protein